MLLREVDRDNLEEKELGWICPKCKIGLSPKVQMCPKCKKIRMKEQGKLQEKQLLLG